MKNRNHRIAVLKNLSIRKDLQLAKRHLKQAVHKWRAGFSVSEKPKPTFDLLNVGCGELIRDGWTNIDINPCAGASFVDVYNGLPFPDITFRHIHSEHFIEHLEQDIAIEFLRECLRILQPGGSIRLIVPDAGKYLHAYAEKNMEFFKLLENLGGSEEVLRTPVEVVNRMFRMWDDHRFAWDFETLSMYMSEVGFAEVKRSNINDVPPQFRIDGDDWWREVESLYVNAVKPSS